ncbi:hypothetical protein SAMN05444170_2554 [Bradyrhizobium erythrophlei]|jgi:hypothetical protein|uniref:Uncharacterized protein n=1 Tax=Bradyrhizobium erythrophlei TaxID=1437360 RepID=A0A1M7TSU6_9BRAD|nr:hypothetical protein SAMN05444170_2554 [Bradyrhizobium erythrophlei]
MRAASTWGPRLRANLTLVEFDIRYSPGRELAEQMSNPKLHWNLICLVVL